jgi:isoquinoline 1-oxidoreductase beta subunit
VPLYEVAAARHDTVKADSGVRVGFWRAVSHNMNVFANESFFDELAHSAKADPVAYRRSLLDEHPRMQKVLDRLVDASGWGKSAPAGRHRGVAAFEGYGTYIGGVLEISMEDGAPKVHKITIVADPGAMVNPDTVEAQIQSSIVYGLSAALWGEITVEKGRVQQSNFDDFRVMRNHEVPDIKIVLMDSTEAPGGIGEPATSLMAPALANAVFAATGKRVRETPITADRIRRA